jgi:hypothetical protein
MVAIHGVPATDLSGVTGDLSTLTTKVDNVQADVTTSLGNEGSIETKVDTAISDIGAVDTKVDTAISDIGAVDTKVDTAISDIGAVDTKVDTAISDIGAVDTKVDTAITDIGAVQTTVNTIDGKADTIITNVVTAITDINNVNVNVNVVNNQLLTIPNLDSSILFQGIKSTTSATLVTIHDTYGSGFLFLAFAYPVAATATGRIVVYVDGDYPANKALDLSLEPGKSGVAACFPFYFKNRLLIKAFSDGTYPLTLSITTAKSVQGQATQVIQVCEDTYIYQGSPTTNYGSNAHLHVSRRTATAQSSLIRFDLAALAGQFVQSATLSVKHAVAVSGMTDGRLYHLLKDWVEAEATWEIYSTGNSWGTDGMESGVDYDATADWNGDFSGSADDWLNMDITALMRRWCQGALSNKGVALVYNVLYEAHTADFYSNDYPIAADRPKLTYLLA